MITPLASLAAAVLSSSTPNRTVELSDPRLLVSGSAISSVTADGDTAYIVTGNTVKKVVYGSDLQVVDSLPKRGGQTWGMSKYVNLGDGLGILAVANLPYDTAFWLVDWKGTSNTALLRFEDGSRWADFSNLGFNKVASQGSPYGFSGESNLVGIRTGNGSAIFAGDKGVFQVVANRNQDGRADLSVVGSKSDSGKFLWSNASLATSIAEGSNSLAFDFAGNTWGKKVALFHSPYAVDDLGWLKLVDSSYSRSPDNANAWNWGFNLASGTGKCWLHVSRNARQALHSCLVDGKLEQDTLQLPSLAKDTVAYLHDVFTARSASGLTLLAGDSMLAFYDWDGSRLPVPAGTLALNKATRSADFGDTTFWHAGGKELRAFRMRTSGTAAVARTPSMRRTFAARATEQGIVITSNGVERLEILDASGRRLGAISTSGAASIEFHTRSKGVLFVRGADRSVQLTRF